jgi:hypothetical protein
MGGAYNHRLVGTHAEDRVVLERNSGTRNTAAIMKDKMYVVQAGGITRFP